jgi:hypothetical protein
MMRHSFGQAFGSVRRFMVRSLQHISHVPAFDTVFEHPEAGRPPTGGRLASLRTCPGFRLFAAAAGLRQPRQIFRLNEI